MKILLLIIALSFSISLFAKESIKFLVVGDWGRSGEYFQKDVAKQMSITAEKENIDFVISTGDNFYQTGVESTEDSHWKESFENIYNANTLQKKWYVVLGNHDYQGNYKAQIDYTKKSNRWYMPSNYFTEVIQNDGTSIRLIFIDSNPFITDYYTEKKYKDKVAGQDTNKQKSWLDSIMKVDKSKYTIVVGHHPPLSSSPKHGGAGEIFNLLKQYNTKINLTLWGHEHDLQHQKVKDFPDVFISGAGSECRKAGKNENTLFALGEVGGFALVEVTKEKIELKFINYKGEVVYSVKL
jgi:predicted phosphohydrolase